MTNSRKSAATKLRPQSVSRVLAKAGFERAESESTSVRGHRRYSPGFEVKGSKAAWEENLTDDPNDDAVYVTVQTIDSFNYGERRSHADIVAALVPGYETALAAAALQTERLDGGHRGFRGLRVTVG